MSRLRAVIKNTVWEMGYYFIVILLGFLAPRFIILAYGSEVNGLSSTITQILNIILILQMGAATASVYALYKPIKEDDIEEICKVVASAERFFRKIAWVFLVVMVVVAGITAFVLDSKIDDINIFVAFCLMGAKSFIDLYFTSKYRIVFTAYQEKFAISIATLIEQILYYGLVFLTILLKLHFIFIYAWFLLGCVVKIIILYAIFNKKHAQINTKQYIKKSGKIESRYYVLANEVAHSVMTSSMTVILSLMYGLEEASVYSVYALVVQALNLISTSIYSSFAPSFGNLVVGDNRPKAREVFDIFQFVFCALNTVLMMCMMFLIVPFVKIYSTGVADVDYLNTTLAFVLVIGGVFSTFRIPYNVLVSTCGFFKETWKQPIVSLPFCILISALFGMIDYPLIFVGSGVFYLINYLYQYFRIKSIAPWLIDAKTFVLFAISLVGIGVAFLASRLIILPDGIMSWIVGAMVCFFVSVVFIILTTFLFDRESFLMSIRYIKKKLDRKTDR